MICIGLISRVIPPRNDKRTACRASTKGSVKSTSLRRPESGSEILLVRQSFTRPNPGGKSSKLSYATLREH